MITDLARNDLGRVARFGSVRVRRLCALERHPGVHHLVSVVEAQLEAGLGPEEIVRATFPPGSVTGAPKIRAMEIIEELEPVRRGVYCGGLGWIDPSGDLELSVAIRTFVATAGRLTLHVGGAVVADSDPSAEWQETMHKGARLLEAAGGELREPVFGRSASRAAERDTEPGDSGRSLKVWLNGELVDEADASISPRDRGFLLGDGVFETLRTYGGRLVTLTEHLERLEAGARVLGISVGDRDAIAAGAQRARLGRGTQGPPRADHLTSGPGPRSRTGDASPTLLITAVPLAPWPETATAVIAPWPHDEHSPLAGVKTTSRADTVLAMVHARAARRGRGAVLQPGRQPLRGDDRQRLRRPRRRGRDAAAVGGMPRRDHPRTRASPLPRAGHRGRASGPAS